MKSPKIIISFIILILIFSSFGQRNTTISIINDTSNAYVDFDYNVLSASASSDGYSLYGTIQNSNGNSWTATGNNIALAIADMNNGDAVHIPPGNYIISNQIEIINKDNLQIIGYDYPNITSSYAGNPIVLRDCKNIKITRLNLTHTDTLLSFAMLSLFGCTNINVEENIFYNLNNSLRIGSNATDDIWSNNIQISNNVFDKYNYSGILASDGINYLTINNNMFKDCVETDTSELAYAISLEAYLWDSDTSGINYVTICDNYIYNQQAHNAIDIHSGSYLQIKDNHIINCTNDYNIYAHAYAIDGWTGPTNCTSWDISGNSLSGGDNYGIGIISDASAGNLTNVRVTNNIITGYRYDAIHVQSNGYPISNLDISCNIIAGQSGAYEHGNAIELNSDISAFSGNVTINDNFIHGLYGVPFGIKEAIWIKNNWSNIHIANNIISGNVGTGVFIWGTTPKNISIIDNSILDVNNKGIDINTGSDYIVFGNIIRNAGVDDLEITPTNYTSLFDFNT